MSTLQKTPATFTIAQLREKTVHVRDNLEPAVAREGARPLDPDTVLDLHGFFAALLTKTPSLEEIQQSRIHRAVLLISGRGTRWPTKLVDMCDLLIVDWTKKFGPLDAIRPNLYGRGGRLDASREQNGLARMGTSAQWMTDPTAASSPLRALEHGALGFSPGQWWIHPLFAFREGIIDSPDSQGGITADENGAYAITATNYDEPDETPSDKFTFECKPNDPGRLKLTKAILPPKRPVRVLRSHTLHSTYAPVAGVRYDGLYNVTGYSIKTVGDETKIVVSLQRLPHQKSMAYVLSHPTAEEVDDYIEYKRLRNMQQTTSDRMFHRAPRRREFEFSMLPRPETPDALGFDPLAVAQVASAQGKAKIKPKSGDGTESITPGDEQALQTLGKVPDPYPTELDNHESKLTPKQRLMAWYERAPLRGTPVGNIALGDDTVEHEVTPESPKGTAAGGTQATEAQEVKSKNLSYDGTAAPTTPGAPPFHENNENGSKDVDDGDNEDNHDRKALGPTGDKKDDETMEDSDVADSFSALKLRQSIDKEAWSRGSVKDADLKA